MKRGTLAKIRAAAGKAGAAARWGAEKRETKTVRIFAEDAAALERRAEEGGRRVADVVHEMLSRP